MQPDFRKPEPETRLWRKPVKKGATKFHYVLDTPLTRSSRSVFIWQK